MTPDRVLREMHEVGLVATEFGPDGFLPDAPREKVDLLAGHGLRAVGGFVPVVLHDPARDALLGLDAVLAAFVTAGADTLVLAADTGLTGYDERVELDERQWRTLLDNLDRIAEAAREHGITATLHPHVGTIIEQESEVGRVLESSRIPLCLDTGHLLIGGSDPAKLAREVPERIAHTHLKDVNADLARSVQKGQMPYTAAVKAGIYRPLGAGDVDIAGIVLSLEGAGYTGWYVLEQDTVLGAEPHKDGGPVEDVRASLAYVAGLAP
ncbi:MAG TPA: sugar phosphate isomerase/epimerase [Pseudonocardiaceae bacterium]|jgi:inosose dehydratase|nr:sugar phosphate isomerase/epimerase [Pseudonocardiaceae bacterium]